MKITKINENWTLQPGGYSFIPGMQAEHRAVQLPHDFVIESDVRPDGKNSSNTGFFNGGTYTYTKRLTVPAEWDGQRILLNFDGVMGNAKLTVYPGVGHDSWVPAYNDPDLIPWMLSHKKTK